MSDPSNEFDQMAMVHRLPKASVVDRIECLVNLAAGRRVVHVGFADAGCQSMQADAGTWLHDHLSRSATSLVGIDLDEAGVDAARARGHEAYVADCRDPGAIAALALEPADLVIAGEVIEHVDSPGPFLDGLHGLVAPGGMLVLTTPNAVGLGNALAALAGFEVNHPDHVTLFSWRTLTTLMARHDWAPVEAHTYVPVLKASPGRGHRALRIGAATLLFIERTVSRMAPFTADGLILVARSTREPVAPAAAGTAEAS